MENILTVVNGIGWFMGALGAAVAVFFVAYSGYLFISAQGDPQRMAQARGSLIGVVVGLVVIGGAFIIPGTISRFVIEPAGGLPVEPPCRVRLRQPAEGTAGLPAECLRSMGGCSS